jgi:SpoVK/Ycf46/Vps4 family AAA+-type ATPase
VRDSDVNLYDWARLAGLFGAFAAEPSAAAPGRVAREIVGDDYRRILTETTRLIGHQWREHIEDSAVKGFLFHGAVGVGKTTMAKRIAYELGRLFETDRENPENEVVLVLVDGADIARGRYGDSEERLAELFEYAREGEGHRHRFVGGAHIHEGNAMRRTVLLFDDVESLFMTRSSGGAREWHFSQNSVFFHAIDELDTSHTAVVLTTNRFDLLDEAIIDRLMPYEFGAPATETLLEVAAHFAANQRLGHDELAPILKRIREEGSVRSIRQVERLVTEAYVRKVTGRG